MNRKWHRVLYLGIASVCLVSSPLSYGRFSHEDIDQVDVEQNLNMEAYNDKVSYRFPSGWQRIWRSHTTGFRLNLGSLNQTKFDFNEEVKVTAETETPFSFAFLRNYSEDLVDRKTEQELRLSLKAFAGTSFHLMGDGAGEKQYGDLGFAVTQEIFTGTYLELYYWSVDHFYGQKRDFKEDRRSRETYTAGFKLGFQPMASTYFLLGAEFDHPLRWHLLSKDYEYEYQRQRVDWEGQVSATGDEGWRYNGYAEFKEEGKTWYLATEPKIAMRRKVFLQEFEHFFRNGERFSSAGLIFVWREANYDRHELEDIPYYLTHYNNLKTSLSERREAGTYVETNAPFSADKRHRLQLGSYLNLIRLTENDVKRRGELKFQTGWEYVLSPKARFFLNATWDVDEIAEAAYRKQRIKAWGGGNMQVIAVF